MRELQVCPPTKKRPAEVVRRLEFRATGGELVAWVGSEQMTKDGRTGFTNALHTYDLVADAAREMRADLLIEWLEWGERTPTRCCRPTAR